MPASLQVVCHLDPSDRLSTEREGPRAAPRFTRCFGRDATYCIGKDGQSCPSVIGLAVYCAGYDIAGRPGAFTLAQKAPPARTSDPVALGYANVESRFFCPSAGAVREVVADYGTDPFDCPRSVVNGLQVNCASPTVPLR